MNLLAIFAHPDDETIFFGGTLAMLAAKGVHLHLVSATRGEGGDVGEPPLCRPDQLGAWREREMHCAAAALGARSLAFLDYIDPTISADGQLLAFEADHGILAMQIGAHIKQLQIEGVITHGSDGEYGHPAHRQVHQAVSIAAKSEAHFMYTFSANFQNHPRSRLANRSDPADFILDIGPWFDCKLAAALCHRTQHALFVRRSSEEAGRQLAVEEVLMRTESLHRSWPPAEDFLEDRLAQFLRQSCAEVTQGTGMRQENGKSTFPKETQDGR